MNLMLTCIRAGGSGAAVDVQHPVRVRPRENAPFFSLGLEGRISIPTRGREKRKGEEGRGEMRRNKIGEGKGHKGKRTMVKS